MSEIARQIFELNKAIEEGRPFAHGDKGGLGIDNPIGLEVKNGVRQVVAERGKVQLPPREKGSFNLVVKQNAMFTALLTSLSTTFPIVCIVRNPVDVLLSWLTVDLPVNRGRIPAGERFDEELRKSLSGKSCLDRQLVILQWFFTRFSDSGLPVVRYEDIVNSGGADLDRVLELSDVERTPMSFQDRHFSEQTLLTLKTAMTGLRDLHCGGLYSVEDIQEALARKGL